MSTDDSLNTLNQISRVIAETASDAIITIDDHSTILFVNRATENIFGYTREELIGHSLTMLMPEYLRHVHHASLARYLETGERHISWEAVRLPGLHKDGSDLHLELSFGEFVEDGKHFFTGIARDIADRKQAEETLRQSEEQFRSLIEMPRTLSPCSIEKAYDSTSVHQSSDRSATNRKSCWEKIRSNCCIRMMCRYCASFSPPEFVSPAS